jgi:hypothetical protein
MGNLSIRTLDWRAWASFAPTWARIHSVSANASLFVSREWVDCWLATYGAELNPELLAFVRDGEVVGCCLLVWRTEWLRVIPLRRVYLNCAGEKEADSTCIEFNSILTIPGCAKPIAEALEQFCRSRYWDELLLSGTIEDESIGVLVNSFPSCEIREMPAPYVDFALLRDSGTDYLNQLSSKTRKNLRRTQRAYEESTGVCTLHLARNVNEGLKMLQQLADLHQVRWESRGQAGVFSSKKFRTFHERLIQQNFDKVLLFRLQAGDEVVGLLHCFVYRGWVYYYQSGFCYPLDRRLSPGMLTVYHVVADCLARPELNGFEFMAGDDLYKRSLSVSPESHVLRWMVIRRKTPSTVAYLGLRKLKREYMRWGQRNQISQSPDSNGQEVMPKQSRIRNAQSISH